MIRRHATRLRRPGFTLLEMLLASAIGVLLMAALYVAVDYQMRHAQEGRDLLEQSLLARSLLTRMGNEIKLGTGLYPPSTAQSNPGAASTTGATGASSSGAGGSTATGTGTSYNRGLQGAADRLVILMNRVPSELYKSPPNASADQAPTGISDLRQITYWQSNGGLTRKERLAVTSDDAVNGWMTQDDDPNSIIADEVQSLQLRYFDGTSWQDSWDATMPGADGTTPLGPPAAVEITIGVRQSGSAGADLKFYKHRVAILVANAPPQQTTGTTP